MNNSFPKDKSEAGTAPSKPLEVKPPDITSKTFPGGNGASYSGQLLEKARAETDAVLKELGSQLAGLSGAEADSRLKEAGTNEIAREKRQSALMHLLGNVKNPLVLLLLALGVLSFLTGDLRATVVIFVMVVLGVVLRFFQEMRADNAAEKLQAMVSNTATSVRDGKEEEVLLKRLVPGDIIRLAAGDMVPADVRVLLAKDLFLNQAALTGEALPVEKNAAPTTAAVQNPLDLPNLCFLGSNVESRSATAVVILTGSRTYFGSLAASFRPWRPRSDLSRSRRCTGCFWPSSWRAMPC
jgi:P-type Mg2+ transporter